MIVKEMIFNDIYVGRSIYKEIVLDANYSIYYISSITFTEEDIENKERRKRLLIAGVALSPSEVKQLNGLM